MGSSIINTKTQPDVNSGREVLGMKTKSEGLRVVRWVSMLDEVGRSGLPAMVHGRNFLALRKSVMGRFVRSFQAEGASRANALWLELGWHSQGTGEASMARVNKWKGVKLSLEGLAGIQSRLGW